GAVAGSVVVFRDVSPRLRAEEERRRLEARVLQAQKLESLGVLAGGVAHDFNNLLTGIIGYTNLATFQLPADSVVVALLGEVEKASQRAAELVRQLLAFAGKGRLISQTVDVNALIGEMTVLLRTVVPNRGELRTDLAADLPQILADTAQLRQVVLSLVTNAGESLEQREGVVHLRTGMAMIDDPKDLPPDTEPGRYVSIE